MDDDCCPGWRKLAAGFFLSRKGVIGRGGSPGRRAFVHLLIPAQTSPATRCSSDTTLKGGAQREERMSPFRVPFLHDTKGRIGTYRKGKGRGNLCPDLNRLPSPRGRLAFRDFLSPRIGVRYYRVLCRTCATRGEGNCVLVAFLNLRAGCCVRFVPAPRSSPPPNLSFLPASILPHAPSFPRLFTPETYLFCSSGRLCRRAARAGRRSSR